MVAIKTKSWTNLAAKQILEHLAFGKPFFEEGFIFSTRICATNG